jgi:hypothetical protein
VRGPFLLGDDPHLDVDVTFQLEHPFPQVRRLADRLASRYGFQWHAADAIAPDPCRPRWSVELQRPAVPSLSPSADVRTCYPLREGEMETVPRKAWDEIILNRRLPALPAARGSRLRACSAERSALATS